MLSQKHQFLTAVIQLYKYEGQSYVTVRYHIFHQSSVGPSVFELTFDHKPIFTMAFGVRTFMFPFFFDKKNSFH